MKKKYLKMVFEVKVPFENVIEEEYFQSEYDNDALRLARWMWKEEGFWFDEELKITKAEVI